jgi:beta-lactamase regulating signal transducer with metallopeptidase domain
LTVLDDPMPAAHALAGTLTHRGRVMVSTGLLRTLDADERAAVLAHEHAHLTHAHRVFTAVNALAVALNPLLSPARGHLAFALERWADEDAAARTNPDIAARALAKAALARLSTLHHGVAPAMSLPLDQLGVPERVAALLARDIRRHNGLAWLVAGLALGGILALAWATHDTERLFEALRTR